METTLEVKYFFFLFFLSLSHSLAEGVKVAY